MSDIYLRYVGKNNGYIFGVPARNMTEEEANKFNIPELIKTGLYELVNKPKEIDAVEKYNFDDEPKRTRKRKE